MDFYEELIFLKLVQKFCQNDYILIKMNLF